MRAGTILEITRLVIEHGLEEVNTPLEAHARLDAIAKVIAAAMLNDKHKIAVGLCKLAERLLWQVPAHVLVEVYLHIERLNGLKSFMIITKYFYNQSQMMMNTRNLGQTNEGS